MVDKVNATILDRPLGLYENSTQIINSVFYLNNKRLKFHKNIEFESYIESVYNALKIYYNLDEINQGVEILEKYVSRFDDPKELNEGARIKNEEELKIIKNQASFAYKVLSGVARHAIDIEDGRSWKNVR
jgi:hypothetical protein